jgi:hypothetical protein
MIKHIQAWVLLAFMVATCVFSVCVALGFTEAERERFKSEIIQSLKTSKCVAGES